MTAIARPASRRRLVSLAPTAVGGLLALIPRLPYIDNDLYLDLSVFMTLGSGLRHGDLPYVDVFDHKGPLTYELYAGFDLLAPGSVVGVRLLGFLFLLAALALLTGMVRRHVGEGAAWVAALAFALAGSSEVYGLDPETEQLALPLLVGAVALGDRRLRDGSVPAAAGAGAAVAAATLLKPTFGLLGLLVLVLILVRPERRIAAVLAAAGGALALSLVALAPWLLGGGMDALRAGVVDYNADYVADASRRLRAAGLRAKVDWLRDIPGLPFLALGFAGAAYSAWRRRRTAFSLTVLAWWALMLLSAKLGIRNIAEYYVTVAPPAAAGIALGTAAIADAIPPAERAARAAVGGLAIVPIAVALLLVPLGNPGVRLVDGPIPFPLGDGLESDQAAIADLRLQEVADGVRAVTRPGDRIYVANDEAQSIYWLADRRPAGRYIFPGIMVPEPFYDEVRAELRRAPPAAVVTFRGVRSDYLREAIADAGLRPASPPDPRYRIYARP